LRTEAWAKAPSVGQIGQQFHNYVISDFAGYKTQARCEAFAAVAALRVRADLTTITSAGQRLWPKPRIFPDSTSAWHNSIEWRRQPPSANQGVRISRKPTAEGQLDLVIRLYLGNPSNSNQKSIRVRGFRVFTMTVSRA
jgi:hypothetical protein